MLDLHKYRTIAMLQILKSGGTVNMDHILLEFRKAGVNLKTGHHLGTLMTPLNHLGLVAKTRSGNETWYYLTELGGEVLAKVLGE